MAFFGFLGSGELNGTLEKLTLYYSIYFQKGVLLSCPCLTAFPGVLLDVCRVKGDQTSHSFCFVAASIAAYASVLVHLVQFLGFWPGDARELYILGLLNPISQPFRLNSFVSS